MEGEIHGKNVSDPSKVTGKEGVWFQHDWYGNDRPIPEIEGFGDERGALPMDDPDFVSYNVWKMEKNYYGPGNAPYSSANYTEGIEDCSHKCHYGGSLIVMGGKKVPPSGYECSDCHPESKVKRYGIEDRNGKSCQSSHAGLHRLSQATLIHGGLSGNTCSHGNSNASCYSNTRV